MGSVHGQAQIKFPSVRHRVVIVSIVDGGGVIYPM